MKLSDSNSEHSPCGRCLLQMQFYEEEKRILASGLAQSMSELVSKTLEMFEWASAADNAIQASVAFLNMATREINDDTMRDSFLRAARRALESIPGRQKELRIGDE